jgi:hypothetical protein
MNFHNFMIYPLQNMLLFNEDPSGTPSKSRMKMANADDIQESVNTQDDDRVALPFSNVRRARISPPVPSQEATLLMDY